MTLSVAEETRSTSSVGNNRAHSDERSGKHGYSNGEGTEVGDRVPKKRPLHDGDGQGEELLHLWRIWAHGLSLQKLGKN